MLPYIFKSLSYIANNMYIPRPTPIIGTASVSPIIKKNLPWRNGANSGCLAIPSKNLLPKTPTPIPAPIAERPMVSPAAKMLNSIFFSYILRINAPQFHAPSPNMRLLTP